MLELANDAIRYHREVEDAQADAGRALQKAKQAEAYFDRCFFGMPGAWTGYHPAPFFPGGITVDPEKLLPALAHLRRFRHYRITGTRVLADNPACPGIRLDLEWVE